MALANLGLYPRFTTIGLFPWMMTPFNLFLFPAVGIFAAFVAAVLPAGADLAREESQMSRFSGEPVPRFASLRYSAVHGRQGPSLDHPIIWRYERAGLPVLIVRETHNWRRIRDSQGDEVWVQARMLSDEPFALVVQDTVMRARRSDESRAVAELEAGVVAAVEACDPDWCKLRIEKIRGLVRPNVLWGAVAVTGEQAEQRLAGVPSNR